jgi:hypothetical protein
MTYRTTLIASLSAVALVLAAGETFANPAGAPGGPAAAHGGPGASHGGRGAAPARPAFPTFRSIHPHHRGVGSFYPAGGYYYGPPATIDEPVAVAPPLKQSDDLRYTCVYDIPWDYVHRCPQFR